MMQVEKGYEMLGEDKDDSVVKCRERRRRRMEMRRLSAVTQSAESGLPEGKKQAEMTSSSTNDDADLSPKTVAQPPIVACDAVVTVAEQEYGTMSIAGRSREMEDAISVRINLCRPEINRSRPVHFFAVFDGHGGHDVAALCREKMHIIMAEEFMRVKSTSESGEAVTAERGLWNAIKRSFERMDEEAMSMCRCGGVTVCNCHPMDVALVGSTAVVAVLTQENIYVGNCGDSRAVLCRAGRAFPLSVDQKPDREDERARIEACGGRVIFANGARVEGILAMSRAIGDKLLKPAVTSEPEISITKRDHEDVCLILASDGLWDVMSSELACEIAYQCLQENNTGNAAPRVTNARKSVPQVGEEGSASGTLHSSRCASAAALLTRLALGRKSADNISVVVVDLRN